MSIKSKRANEIIVRMYKINKEIKELNIKEAILQNESKYLSYEMKQL